MGKQLFHSPQKQAEKPTERERTWASSLMKRSAVRQKLGRDDTQRGVWAS